MKIPKNTTLKTFLLGDFDGDGVLNIDDPYPFNKKRTYPPKNDRTSKHYHRSRYYDPDVKLSIQLIAIQKHNNSHEPYFNNFLRNNPTAFGRIKSVPSTLNKIIHKEQFHKRIVDVAAVTIPSKNRKGVYRNATRIKRRYNYDPTMTRDYYKNPKGGTYYGFHLGLINHREQRMEVQFKSERMIDYSQKMHEDYKKDKSLKKYEKKGKALFKKGY